MTHESKFWALLGTPCPESEEEQAYQVLKRVRDFSLARNNNLVHQIAAAYTLDDFHAGKATGVAILIALQEFPAFDAVRQEVGDRLRSEFEVDDFGRKWLANLLEV